MSETTVVEHSKPHFTYVWHTSDEREIVDNTVQPTMSDLYASQGWKGAKIPADFRGDIIYQGVIFNVYPSKPSRGLHSRQKPHRIYWMCKCGKSVPAGRIAQHLFGRKGRP